MGGMEGMQGPGDRPWINSKGKGKISHSGGSSWSLSSSGPEFIDKGSWPFILVFTPTPNSLEAQHRDWATLIQAHNDWPKLRPHPGGWETDRDKECLRLVTVWVLVLIVDGFS